MNAEVDPISVVNIPLAPEGIVGADVDRWEKEMGELADEAASVLRSEGITSREKYRTTSMWHELSQTKQNEARTI